MNITYHILAFPNSGGTFVFRQEERNNNPDGLTLIERKSNSQEAVVSACDDMVRRQKSGNIVFQEFPTDFLCKHYLNKTVSFLETKNA